MVCIAWDTKCALVSRVTMPMTGVSKPTSTWSNIERASSLAEKTMTLSSLCSLVWLLGMVPFLGDAK